MIGSCSRSTCYFKLRLLYWKHIFFFRLSFATFGPGSKIYIKDTKSYHCKMWIPYSQALRLNRICSDSDSFDGRCNNLKKWFIERGYSEQEVRKQIVRARCFSRDSLLDWENTREEQNKITFNLTYYLVFQNVKKILPELHLLLTHDVAHKAVFTNVPIIGFKNDWSLKDHLVWAVLPKIEA